MVKRPRQRAFFAFMAEFGVYGEEGAGLGKRRRKIGDFRVMARGKDWESDKKRILPLKRGSILAKLEL